MQDYCTWVDQESRRIQLSPLLLTIGLLSAEPHELTLFSESFFDSRTLYQHHILFDKFINRSHFILKYCCHNDLTGLILSTIQSAIDNGYVYHDHDKRGNCITKYYATHSFAVGTFTREEELHKKYHQFTLCVIWRFWEFITAYPVGEDYIESKWGKIQSWDRGVEYPKGEGYDYTEDSYSNIRKEEKT